MVHFCAVPGCSNRSNREVDRSYFGLPLHNKVLLKTWIHKIGRVNLPINANTRICSDHFVSAAKRKLQPDEYPTLSLPVRSHTTTTKPRRPPTVRTIPEPLSEDNDEEASVVVEGTTKSVAIQACDVSLEVIENLKGTVAQLKADATASKFCIENISKDEQLVTFYSGFPNYATLKSCYDYLGPTVDNLMYWGSKDKDVGHGRSRALSSFNEFFLVLVRLRLGLLERDLAYRFKISVSTVSRICRTWVHFMYLRFKEIPLWSSRDLVNLYMPKGFKELYPTTRVIIDATEIYVEAPALPELQQMTFSSYKNNNTYKGLIGISPGGAITFISKLYPGSISDQMLTRKSGLLDLLEKGDSVMADRGFNIQDDLTPLGVKINIPPFLKGKMQLEPEELVETRRIASLRIHVERAMERIKNYHIFDRTLPSSLTDVAEETFFVCAVMCNFLPPLCS